MEVQKKTKRLRLFLVLVGMFLFLFPVGGAAAAYNGLPTSIQINLKHDSDVDYCIYLLGEGGLSGKELEEQQQDIYRQAMFYWGKSDASQADWVDPNLPALFREDFVDGKGEFTQMVGGFQKTARIVLLTPDGTVTQSPSIQIQSAGARKPYNLYISYDLAENKILSTMMEEIADPTPQPVLEVPFWKNFWKALAVCTGWLVAFGGCWLLLGRKPLRNLYVIIPDLLLQGGLLAMVVVLLLNGNSHQAEVELEFALPVLGAIRLAAYPGLLRGRSWITHLLYAVLVTAISIAAVVMLFQFCQGYAPSFLYDAL